MMFFKESVSNTKGSMQYISVGANKVEVYYCHE